MAGKVGYDKSDSYSGKQGSEKEGGGIFQRVAAIAEAVCLLLADGPGMRLVTVQTTQFCLRHMELVLSNPGLTAVAVLQTVLAGGFKFTVGMMTVETFQ